MENEFELTEENKQKMQEGLQALLQNPELLKSMKELLGNARMPKEEPNVATSSDSMEESTPAAEILPKEDLLSGDGLFGVLSNPQIMEKLPQMMALLKPMMQSSSSGGKKDSPQKPRTQEESRNDLLCSLKPFLSKNRQEAVDAMMKISNLGKVLKQLN